jgi:hypothetical protein
MGRRDSKDPQWIKLKKLLILRDKGMCRFLRICTPREAMALKKNAGPRINTLDPAHIIACGTWTEGTYLLDNVVLLNRYSHDMLDNCRNPATGEMITYEERENFWMRIAGSTNYNTLKEMQYGCNKQD